jgi:FAD/FMN-containing dehydrogenase
MLQLSRVGDKQKVFKLINDYAGLVVKYNGSLLADSAEGRLKTYAVYSRADEGVIELFKKVRKIFDPYSTLNPGVKQENELKQLVAMLRSEYN